MDEMRYDNHSQLGPLCPRKGGKEGPVKADVPWRQLTWWSTGGGFAYRTAKKCVTATAVQHGILRMEERWRCDASNPNNVFVIISHASLSIGIRTPPTSTSSRSVEFYSCKRLKITMYDVRHNWGRMTQQSLRR